jgi:DNA-binding MarR family transcriptional regulator
MGTTEKEQRLVARALLQAHEKFAQYMGKGDVPIQTFSTFLVVAERVSDFPMQELQDILGISQSSVSRNVTLLSLGSASLEPPKLIEAFEDPDYRRRKHVRLTAKGRKLMEEIMHSVKKAGA